MNALSYLIQVNLYLLLFYTFYVAVLRNETFFKINRIYLVSSALLSMCIPIIKTDWIKDLFITEEIQGFTQTVSYAIIDQEMGNLNTPANIQSQSVMTPATWLWLIYAFVTLVFLLNFLRKLYAVNKLFKLKIKGRAFSFFGRVSVDDQLEGKETILNHELVHAKQWHSADVIFFELLLAINWFNPIVYLYRIAIKNIHEFIADDSAASTLEDRSAYALLLVSNVFNTEPQQLTNNFFNQSLLKRRIIMLHKTKSRKVAILKYGLSAPLFAIMLIFSSALGVEAQITQVITKAMPGTDGLMKINLTNPKQIVEKLTKTVESNPTIEAHLNSEPSPNDKTNHAVTRMVDNKKKVKSEMEYPKDSKIPTGSTTSRSVESHLQNLMDYVRTFRLKQGPDEIRKEGLMYISFDVNDSKKASNFKVIKSVDPDLEAKMLTHLSAFSDTVSLKSGTYNFYDGQYFAFSGDDYKRFLDKDIPFVFGSVSIITVQFSSQDETKSEAARIVNYVKAPYLTTPIILVDGKVANYEVTEKGFKLDETINVDKQKTRILKGDAAVAEYNESARNGLIVIATKESDTSRNN